MIKGICCACEYGSAAYCVGGYLKRFMDMTDGWISGGVVWQSRLRCEYNVAVDNDLAVANFS